MKHFSKKQDEVQKFVSEEVGVLDKLFMVQIISLETPLWEISCIMFNSSK